MKFLKIEKSIKSSNHIMCEYIKITFLGIKISFHFKALNMISEPCIPQPLNPVKPKIYLSVVAILKNEAPYIKEWIEFHKLVGVERFYLYNNDSEDNVKEILSPYINDGTVIYQEVSGSVRQMPVYRDAIYRYRDETQWMAFIDLDEYIVPVEKDNIKDFLKDYEDYPAVGINWVMFDSNNHKTAPSDMLITEDYTRVHKDYNMKENLHIKSIVNPRKVLMMYNPHFCIYPRNNFAVTENYEIIEGPFTKYNSVEKIRINHYHCKSEQEYIAKVSRGGANSTKKRTLSERCYNFSETTHDYVMRKYLPKLREKIHNCPCTCFN